MEELTLLDFDLDSVPDIYADILCAEIISLDEKHIFEHSGCHEFVITLSDNIVSEIYSNELFHHRATYPAYTFTSIKDNHKYIFFPKKDGRLLHIKSNIYALQESKQSPLELNRSYLPLNIKIDVMTPTDYEQYFPSIKDIIIHIAKSLESTNAINEILRRQVENIIIMLLSISLSIINTVMHSISGIALTNITSLGKHPFELSVSNVYIWSENPEAHNDAKLLQTNNTQHKYIEIPRKSDEYVYEYNELSPEINNSFGKLTVTENDDFKLWLFPNADSNPLYLSKDRYKAVVTLKLKCSQACDLLLHLYSIPNYFSISYPLTVVKPNVWQSFIIPIINSSTSNIFHPLVVRAINYIKDNYGTKLTIENIAEPLHIHPSYLSAIFKKSTGLSVNNYINNYRITIAKQLLANTENDISTIANMTGFYDSQHFLKTFKKVCGTTPKKFRKNLTVL
ncbi:MAG: helix-turn-helix transcriptional regulator [Acutalibacteraceae bacterium]